MAPMSAFEMNKRRAAAASSTLPGVDAEAIPSTTQDPVGDADILEDDVIMGESVQPVASSLVARCLSTWEPTSNSVRGRTASGWLQLRLAWTANGPEHLVLIGQYELRVKRGKVSIYGAVLEEGPQVHRVFAPSTHALPHLMAWGTKATAIIQVRGMRNSMSNLARLSPLYRRIWNDPATPEPELLHEINQQGFSYLKFDTDDPLKRPLYRLDTQVAINRLRSSQSRARNQIVMVSGLRRAGKSTLCRSIVNDKLTTGGQSHVYYLDLDPGQTEFSSAAQVSLVKINQPSLGPPFSHPSIDGVAATQIIKTHVLPSIAYNEHYEQYNECCLDLIRTLRTIQDGPVVVNFPGINVVNMQGLKSLKIFAESLKPTDIAWLCEPNNPLTLQVQLVAQSSNAALQQLPVQSHGRTNRTAVQLRDMMSISYFHAEGLQSTSGSDQRLGWNTEPVLHSPNRSLRLKAAVVAEVNGPDAEVMSARRGFQFRRVEGAREAPCSVRSSIVALASVREAQLLQEVAMSRAAISQVQLICLGVVGEWNACEDELVVKTPEADLLKRHMDEGEGRVIAIQRDMHMPLWAKAETVYLERERRQGLRRDAADSGALTALELALLDEVESAADAQVAAGSGSVGIVEAKENFQVGVKAGESEAERIKRQRRFEYGSAVWRGCLVGASGRVEVEDEKG